MSKFRLFFLIPTVALAACGSEIGDNSVGGTVQLISALEFCGRGGPSQSLRHTYVLLDGGALARTESPQEFADRNANIRDIVLAYADPDRAISSGVSANGERISIYVLERASASAKMIFKGCVPLSAGVGTGDSGKLSDFFTGGDTKEIEEAISRFRRSVILSLINASKSKAAEEDQVSDFPAVAQRLRASGRLVDLEFGLPRVVLISNLNRLIPEDLPSDTTEARARGFKDGRRLGLDFSGAELHVHLADLSGPLSGKEYNEAFFLAQKANIVTWGVGVPGAVPLPPVVTRFYSGQAEFPGGRPALQVRLAADRTGRLVNSWIILRAQHDLGVPLTGQYSCDSSTSCSAQSDNGGFSQAWSTRPGGQAEYSAEMPFGGLRQWRLSLSGDDLTGRIYDENVTMINEDPSFPYIPLSGSKAVNQTF